MKCNPQCIYYQAEMSSKGISVICLIRGQEIKNIKNHTPKVYEDCEKYKDTNKK